MNNPTYMLFTEFYRGKWRLQRTRDASFK